MTQPTFKTEEDLSKKVIGFFEDCETAKKRPSKAGLRVFLNISKSTYSEYKKKYPNPIKRAEDLIEEAWVQRLDSPAATGAIFYLKNAFQEDYKDRHNTDVTSGGKEIQSIVYLPAKPKKE